MLSQPEIEQLIAKFDDPGKLHGLLLHGSFAKEDHDEQSDIDLICVTRAEGEQIREACFLQRNIDLYAGSQAVIRSAFTKVSAKNNNVILNAFNSGRILVDRDGIIDALCRDAKFIWNKGPLPIHLHAQNRRLSLLRKGLQRSRRFAARLEASAVSRQMFRIFVDDVFQEAVWLYCRVERRWASHLRETIEWLHRDDREFHSLCEAYLLCENLPRRVEQLALVIDLIERKISAVSNR